MHLKFLVEHKIIQVLKFTNYYFSIKLQYTQIILLSACLLKEQTLINWFYFNFLRESIL